MDLNSLKLTAAAAAAAESLQSCLTLCDPIDGSPLGSPVPGFSRQEHWSGYNIIYVYKIFIYSYTFFSYTLILISTTPLLLGKYNYYLSFMGGIGISQ